MPTDYALAVELVDGPGVKFGDGSTWARLVATYQDQVIPLKAQAVYDAAYAVWEAEQAAELPFLAYADSFYAQRKAIAKIFMTFSEGFRTAGAAPSLAQYQQVLTDTFVKIYALPTAFVNEFDTEKTALALPALAAAPNYANSLVIADCRTWHRHLGDWIGRVMAGAAIASAVKA